MIDLDDWKHKANDHYVVTKRVEFEAAHRLNRCPPGHKCKRPHGHSYKVDVTVSGNKLDECGFVVDFGVISKLIKDAFDHRDINEVFVSAGVHDDPTAENIAKFIYLLVDAALDYGRKGAVVSEVVVHETNTCAATYRRVSR